jgi:hypothetical protein
MAVTPYFVIVENVAEPDHDAATKSQKSFVNDESKLAQPLQ